MKSPALNVRGFILSQGLDDGWPVFVGTEPSVGDNVITVYDTGGTHANADGEYDDPTIMVRVRARDYSAGYNAATRIKRELLALKNAYFGGFIYTGFWLLSDISRTHRDDNLREIFTVNFRAMREPEPTVTGITWDGGVTWDNGVYWL